MQCLYNFAKLIYLFYNSFIAAHLTSVGLLAEYASKTQANNPIIQTPCAILHLYYNAKSTLPQMVVMRNMLNILSCKYQELLMGRIHQQRDCKREILAKTSKEERDLNNGILALFQNLSIFLTVLNE